MNRAERVIAFLEQRPDVWIEAVRFEPLGGRQAWRTAISEARAIVQADGRDIVNRTRQQIHEGHPWTLSEYMLVSAKPEPVRTTQPHNLNVASAGSLF